MIMKLCTAALALMLVLFLAACGNKGAVAPGNEPGKVEEKPAVKPGEMVIIPAGEFVFGIDNKDSTSYPEQKINLPAYWIDKYEVTNREFLDFSIKSGYSGEGAKEGKDWRAFVPAGGNVPVVYITYNDAAAYCKSLGKRLPTEEEWEKAARGTDGRRFPWGNDWLENRSNTPEAGVIKPADIGKYDDVSPLGVHDMLGNVQEWTASWYKAYKGNTKKNPDFGERLRVVRGASARIYGKKFHLANRSAYLPNSLYDFGCRCAKDATPEEAAGAAPAK
jgi:formylglycine-generating enzyme required for sulfatase activity